MKLWFYRLAGIFGSVILVYLAVRRMDLSETLRMLGNVRIVPPGPAAVAHQATFLPVCTCH